MIRWKQDSDALTVYLSGEIDHFASEKLRSEIESLMKKAKGRQMVLDFSDVTFMDSSGIGMLIGRYKTMAALGGKLYACGLHAPIERLYRMAGLHRIISILQEEAKPEERKAKA